MEQWTDTLRQRRSELVDRGARLAERTRDRGLDVLGKVRDGALDWHATLESRRDELEGADGGWFRFTGLQLVVLDRFDRALVSFGERVRAEIQRLGQLELGAPRGVGTVAKGADTKKAAAKKATAKRATAKKATAKKATAKKATAKKAAAKKATAKNATAKNATAKNAAAKPGASAGVATASTAKTKAAKSTAAAERAETEARARPTTRLVMPIEDYDARTAKEILAELPRLTDSQRKTVLEHERANKARKTVLAALEAS